MFTLLRRLWNADLPFSLAVTGIIGACLIAYIYILLVLQPTGTPTLIVHP